MQQATCSADYGSEETGVQPALVVVVSTDIVATQTPEEQELARKQAELATLEAELAQGELDFATLRAELHAFEARYLRIVGARYAQLDEIKAQIAEALADAAPREQKSRTEARRARAQAHESADAAGQAGDEGEWPHKFQPSENLRKLYREVARRIHPDLGSDDQDRDRRTQLMAEANRAYEEGDEARLQAILQEWESSPEAVKGEGTGAELVRVIRKIAQVRRRLRDIETEIAGLKESDFYKLKVKVDQAEAEGCDLLVEMVARLDGQIAEARQELAATIRGPTEAWTTRR
jgi:chromosome segregation ATPase